ncbi:hypothetical protein A2U01_0106856 [Trifolium medium]|uniref:Uncharacterized protein n=1 Tax=Trifolium medium TaxID=97028 RepID=A0A392VBQ6_9FABA|nr:hypothetical protein [Trifolium medium]
MLAEREMARESELCPKVPRSSQQVSGCCQDMLAGRGIARWASWG